MRGGPRDPAPHGLLLLHRGAGGDEVLARPRLTGLSTVLTLLCAAALLWLAASVLASWTKALLLLVPVGLGTLWALRRLGRPLGTLLFLAFLPLSTCLLLEIALRSLPPSILGMELASMVQTPYRFASDGIYDWDDDGLRRLRPHLSRRYQFMGHGWLHETNGDGWRDDEGALTSTGVVMGDSMVYGHGVERADTLEARLEKASGERVLNAAMQGSQALEALRLLRGPLKHMRPRWLVFMAHGTDPWDLSRSYHPAELEAFVAGKDAPLPRPLRWTAQRSLPFHRWLLATPNGSALLRAVNVLRCRIRDIPAGPGLAAMQNLARPQLRAGWRGELRAIEELGKDCRARGCRFLVIQSYLEEGPLKELSEFCARKGLAFRNPWKEVEAARDRGEEVILPRDGHPSGLGNAILAKDLAAWIRAGSPRDAASRSEDAHRERR